MPYPAAKAFNPQVSNVPVLDASSGNPKSFQDPKSIASIGAKLQSMTDQVQADTLYDTTKEGFRGGRVCSLASDPSMCRAISVITLGVVLIYCSYRK
jgi:hypothetical protein